MVTGEVGESAVVSQKFCKVDAASAGQWDDFDRTVAHCAMCEGRLPSSRLGTCAVFLMRRVRGGSTCGSSMSSPRV